MGKGLILGLWGCIITLAASYGAMMLTAPVKKAESKPSYFGGIDYVKVPMVVAPIIKKKKLAGYILAEFVFTIEQKKLNAMSVRPEPFLVDAAFRRLYTSSAIDAGHIAKLDLDKLLADLLADVNKRYGKPVVKEVLVERMSFLPEDSVRSGSYDTSNLARSNVPTLPAKGGH